MGKLTFDWSFNLRTGNSSQESNYWPENYPHLWCLGLDALSYGCGGKLGCGLTMEATTETLPLHCNG